MSRPLLRLLLGVLALLQGLSPLLHAHVMPPDGGQSGLHVHAVALGPAVNCGSTVSLTLAGVAESAAIMAPTEHRRDESLGGAACAAPPCAAPVAPAAIHSADQPAPAASVPIAAALRLPPAQGPPGDA